MNLPQLIQSLESAAELATDGDAKVERYDDPRRVDRFISAPKAWIAQSVMPSSAQAIAIRHNTATQVLSELKKLDHVLECEETNGMLDAFLHSVDMKNADAKRYESELKAQRARADRLETQLKMIAVVLVREGRDLYGCPGDYVSYHRCGLCQKSGEEVEFDDSPGPVPHNPDCLLYTPPEATP